MTILSIETPWCPLLLGLMVLSSCLGYITAASSSSPHHSWAKEGCTHGHLYLTDVDSTTVRVFDLNAASLSNLAPAFTLNVPGIPGQYLHTSSSTRTVAVITWGNETLFFADGETHFVNTGASTVTNGVISYATPPELITGTVVKCPQPYHFLNNGDKISIGCDGSYEATPQVNNTFYVVDEDLLLTGDGANAIVYTGTELGSHHGAAVAFGDALVLHTVSVPDRINRIDNSTELWVGLPSTLKLVDFEGTVVDTIANLSDANRHCSSLHGWSVSNTSLSMACDNHHGGILLAEVDVAGRSVSSRALMYPDFMPNLRASDWSGVHRNSPYIISDLSSWEEELPDSHLMAIQYSTETITKDHILTLTNTSICGYGFDQSNPETVVVWLGTGIVQLYAVDPMWTMVKEQSIVPNMMSCDDAAMVIGYQQVFVMHFLNKTLFAIDIEHAAHNADALPVAQSTLDFTPAYGIVAGVIPGTECVYRAGDNDKNSTSEGETESDSNSTSEQELGGNSTSSTTNTTTTTSTSGSSGAYGVGSILVGMIVSILSVQVLF